MKVGLKMILPLSNESEEGELEDESQTIDCITAAKDSKIYYMHCLLFICLFMMD